MYFRLDLTVRNMQLEKDFEIDYGGKHQIKVILCPPTAEEQKIGHKEENPFCIVSGQWAPKDQFLSAFKNLANNQMPKGSQKTDEWSVYGIDQDGNMKNKHLPLRILPVPFASFIEQVKKDLYDYARRTVNILRWRSGIEGPHNSISTRNQVWSFDGQHWEPLPSERKAYMWPSPYVRFSSRLLEDVRKYVGKGDNQPLGYELYLEAWEQRHENRRSALVIGIAAAETAIKQCIIFLDPTKKQSLETEQSPSIIKMLSEDIPLLPTKNKMNKKAIEPHSALCEALEKGVSIRNQIVHGRSTTITYETLEEILLAINDILWILDYCSGYNWALEYIRPDIRKALEE